VRIHNSAKPPRPDRAALRFEFWAAPDDAWLDRKTVAAGLGMSVSWLEKLVTQGSGPPYRSVGTRKVVYRRRDVLRWFDEYAHDRRTSSVERK
jgi:predicted DNA-binding transcriptional regulator AlpA